MVSGSRAASAFPPVAVLSNSCFTRPSGRTWFKRTTSKPPALSIAFHSACSSRISAPGGINHRNSRQHTRMPTPDRGTNPGRITKGSAATSSSPRQATAMRNRSPRPAVEFDHAVIHWWLWKTSAPVLSHSNRHGTSRAASRSRAVISSIVSFMKASRHRCRVRGRCAPFPSATEVAGGLPDEQ